MWLLGHLRGGLAVWGGMHAPGRWPVCGELVFTRCWVSGRRRLAAEGAGGQRHDAGGGSQKFPSGMKALGDWLHSKGTLCSPSWTFTNQERG